MQELFTFDDVLIVPKFSKISSRKDVDLSVNVPGLPYMALPVISANMDTVTGYKMATAMICYGGQSVLHRFCSIEDNVNMFLDSRIGPASFPLVSIGLGKTELDRAVALKDAGAYCFFIDVAHGAQLSVVNQAIALRKIIMDNGSIIVGNFATGESVKTFLEHSCNIIDGIKIGVGPGSNCVTRLKTGVGYPQLSAILDISNTLKNTGLAIIADGGMRTSGDIAKAIGAGAHMVMLGGMLAGTDATPGEKLYEVWDTYTGQVETISESTFESCTDRYTVKNVLKKYRGSASKESYEAQGKTGHHRTSEGESFYVPYKGPLIDVLQDISGGLRSAMTYVGASNMKEFRSKVDFVKVSSATKIENGAHGAK